ncbi:unnamed protein product [Euphydryas editha]|uniref:Uncharacterized protein n=1 Tax=Euphydryas editha TaxID=104508 RepID=A0AAU9UET5_EUPED|nr:unnamed protein product [Euphydryas editha]
MLHIDFNSMLKQFNDNLKISIIQELLAIKREVKDTTQSTSFINQKFELIKTEQEASTKKVKDLEVENEKLKQTVRNLNRRYDRQEQQSRSSNSEIQCVPEMNQKYLCTISTQLAEIKDDEIKIQIFYTARPLPKLPPTVLVPH